MQDEGFMVHGAESMVKGAGRSRPGGNPGANLKSISHRCCLREVAFEWELTKETIHLPLGCLQGDGYRRVFVEVITREETDRQLVRLDVVPQVHPGGNQGQNNSFFCQLPYTCYLEELASVGD